MSKETSITELKNDEASRLYSDSFADIRFEEKKIRNCTFYKVFVICKKEPSEEGWMEKILRMGQSYIPVNQFLVSRTYHIFKNILQDFFSSKIILIEK